MLHFVFALCTPSNLTSVRSVACSRCRPSDFIKCDRRVVQAACEHAGKEIIIEEWTRLFSSGSAEDDEVMENLRYVAFGTAGVSKAGADGWDSRKPFQNGWIRDHDEAGNPIPERMGKTLEWFVAHPKAREAGLKAGHVLALRLYSTKAYININTPLRDWKIDHARQKPVSPIELAKPHPLPITIAFLCEGLRLMRKVSEEAQKTVKARDAEAASSCNSRRWGDAQGYSDGAGTEQREERRLDPERPTAPLAVAPLSIETEGRPSIRPASASVRTTAGPRSPPARRAPKKGVEAPTRRVLWRGMRGVTPTPYFMQHGGCEMSPMSTTESLTIAVRYARDCSDGAAPTALLFKLQIDNFLDMGADLSFISAFVSSHSIATSFALLLVRKLTRPHSSFSSSACDSRTRRSFYFLH